MPKYTHRTRSGLPARIICTDIEGATHTVVALILRNNAERAVTLTPSLNYSFDGETHDLDLFEAKPWEFERPSKQVVKVGQTFMSCLYDASVRKSLGGLGGCQAFDLSDFPVEFHDLIQAYLDEELCSVEANYIAMRRAEAQHAGQ